MSWLKRAVLVAALAVGLYMLADFLFLSDEERIDALIEQGKGAVEVGDYAVIDSMVSEDYDFHGKNREEFLTLARKILDKYAPMTLMFWNEKIKILKETGAEVEFLVLASPRERSQLPGSIKCPFRLHFKEQDGAWKVTGVEPIR